MQGQGCTLQDRSGQTDCMVGWESLVGLLGTPQKCTQILPSMPPCTAAQHTLDTDTIQLIRGSAYFTTQIGSG